mmetsp:Transcript_21812/g.49672  ORF Transcript_21812/g.49672 Transcript_21812/m.49672 type:complete len:347 (+) Transcript_21812:68-1108(+)
MPTFKGLAAVCVQLFLALILGHYLKISHAMRPQYKARDSAADHDSDDTDYKMALVSASYGDRGFTHALPTPPLGVLCVLYTDHAVELEHVNGWTVVRTPYHAQVQERWPELYANGPYSDAKALHPATDRLRNTIKAKFYKMSMHWLPEVQGIHVLMWADADYLHSWENTTHLADSITKLLDGRDIVIEKHPYRQQVRAEAEAASGTAWKVAGLANMRDKDGHKPGIFPPLETAVKHQAKEGFKDDQGLFMCAIFAVNASSPTAQLFMKSWYHEVQKYVYRDQISFPFVRWKLGTLLQTLPVDALGNLLQEGDMNASLPDGRHRQDWNKVQSQYLRDKWLAAHHRKR